jgi:hypothetical protein
VVGGEVLIVDPEKELRYERVGEKAWRPGAHVVREKKK